jgi:hypothetical protein
MGPGDPIPGWGQTLSSPASERRRSIPDRLAFTWQTYRAHWRTVLALAIPIQGILGLITLPAYATTLREFQDLLGGNLFSSDDPSSLHRFATAYLPNGGPAELVWALGPAASFAVVVLLTVAFALVLESDTGALARPRLSTIVARSSAFLIPLVIVILAGIVFVLLEVEFLTQTLTSTSIDTIQPEYLPLLGIAFDVVVLGGVIALVYAVARWVLAIPIAALERRGLRSALGRSSQLSQGNRVQVLLSLAVPAFLVGLMIPLVPLAGAALAEALFGSGSPLAIALGSLVALAALIATAPFVPITIVMLYQDLRGPVSGPEPDLS